MNLANLQKTLAIVSKYVNPEKDYCSAEHDILYFPLMSDAKISEEDEAELKRLGARKDRDADCWATFT